MKEFMDEKFLLDNKIAQELYYSYASKMPIYDYHCHLDASEISENKKFSNMHELWLGHDHYKWRAMRWNGIKEDYITGEADEYEKFMAWAKAMPYCMGNPLYHWSHLELKRYFSIYDVLDEKTAPFIWQKCNELLQSDEYSARRLIERSNVKVICTTDDPVDNLIHHKKIRQDKEFNVKVLPTFRPDKAYSVNKNAVEWVNKLSKACNMNINSFEDFLKALKERIHYFHNEGCRISDHSVEEFMYIDAASNELYQIFERLLNGEKLNSIDANKYRTAVITFLGREYSKLGWTMQLHIGAVRNSNTRRFMMLGRDSGFDSMNDNNTAHSITKLLDALERDNDLPKTILYCLNPRDYEVLGVIAGTFQGDIPGKIQLGAAWWFNDHKDGIIKHLKTLSNLGLLRRFVGMLTDSRSFISYPRHEYFRRILCSQVGRWAEEGEVPNDIELLGNMIMEISYNNAVKYFGINV